MCPGQESIKYKKKTFCRSVQNHWKEEERDEKTGNCKFFCLTHKREKRYFTSVANHDLTALNVDQMV